jgi:hypothetical protein
VQRLVGPVGEEHSLLVDLVAVEDLDGELALDRHHDVDHTLEFVGDEGVRRVQRFRDVGSFFAPSAGHQSAGTDLHALVRRHREARVVPGARSLRRA